MSWLTPLGFLGLISLIALIIIYIIKPNYQVRYISTTYVWLRSLKFRKKKLPLNKLRNILLFLCQVLLMSILPANTKLSTALYKLFYSSFFFKSPCY